MEKLKDSWDLYLDVLEKYAIADSKSKQQLKEELLSVINKLKADPPVNSKEFELEEHIPSIYDFERIGLFSEF